MECQVDKKENFRHLLLFAFNRGAKATEAAQEIYEVYGEEAMPLKAPKGTILRDSKMAILTSKTCIEPDALLSSMRSD